MGSRKVEKECRVENASRQHSRHTKAENKMELWAMMTMFCCEEVKLYHIFEKKVKNFWYSYKRKPKISNILTKQKFIYYLIVYLNFILKKNTTCKETTNILFPFPLQIIKRKYLEPNFWSNSLTLKNVQFLRSNPLKAADHICIYFQSYYYFFFLRKEEQVRQVWKFFIKNKKSFSFYLEKYLYFWKKKFSSSIVDF